MCMWTLKESFRSRSVDWDALFPAFLSSCPVGFLAGREPPRQPEIADCRRQIMFDQKISGSHIPDWLITFFLTTFSFPKDRKVGKNRIGVRGKVELPVNDIEWVQMQEASGCVDENCEQLIGRSKVVGLDHIVKHTPERVQFHQNS